MKFKIILLLAFLLVVWAAAAQTNAASLVPPAGQDPNDWFNWMVSLNNRLLGLPAGVLVFLVMLGIDSVLYYAEFCRNRNIPIISIVCGAFLYCMMSVRGDVELPARIWMTRNIVFGVLAGIAAWLVSLRYGQGWVLKIVGRPDPAAPLPETPHPPQKIEVEVTGVVKTEPPPK